MTEVLSRSTRCMPYQTNVVVLFFALGHFSPVMGSEVVACLRLDLRNCLRLLPREMFALCMIEF